MQIMLWIIIRESEVEDGNDDSANEIINDDVESSPELTEEAEEAEEAEETTPEIGDSEGKDKKKRKKKKLKKRCVFSLYLNWQLFEECSYHKYIAYSLWKLQTW